MNKSKIDEEKVSAYFQKLNLNTFRYSKKEMRTIGQTPDFILNKNGEPIFYCEVIW